MPCESGATILKDMEASTDRSSEIVSSYRAKCTLPFGHELMLAAQVSIQSAPSQLPQDTLAPGNDTSNGAASCPIDTEYTVCIEMRDGKACAAIDDTIIR